jgi:tetratricopeptide (TPR) repeat protein
MRVHACGRLTLYPRRSWERFLTRSGGKVAARPQDASLIVIGGGAAGWPEEKLRAILVNADRRGTPIVSERAFLRRLGVLPPLADETRSFSRADVAGRARLTIETVRLLALFDVLEGDGEKFGFRALKGATAAASLLTRVALGDLVAACHRVRSAFNIAEPLSELQLTSEHGRIVVSAGGRIADLDGQLRLELQLPRADIEALLSTADEAKQAGHSDYAERQLRQALAASPKDADALFELGSLLCEEEKFTEGMALLRKATRFHPDFADAWYNLGHALERQKQTREARGAYLRAAEVDPNYADPLFNLGMLYLEDGDYAGAIAQFDRYLALDSHSEWAKKARKAIALARLYQVRAAAG